MRRDAGPDASLCSTSRRSTVLGMLWGYRLNHHTERGEKTTAELSKAHKLLSERPRVYTGYLHESC
ncbi:hypothetical protein J6590_029699 [Homalodisca vitripennis]|nr:hypothetical protein J6590_029699 [Homalodisca vitripennis]